MLPPLHDIAVDEKAKKNGHSVSAAAEGSPILDTPGTITSLFFPVGAFADNIPAWNIYPTVRDRFLRTFYKSETHFASATYSMTSFAKTLTLTLDGLPMAKKYSQQILNDCGNGEGYRSLTAVSAVDLFTTDNGVFWELIGAGRADKPLKGKLLAPYVVHLDSLNCWRTLDPEFPVVYVNPLKNTFHKLHYTRVIARSSMPQPDELARGIGYCAASRILRYAQLLRDQLIYRHEKISGSFTRAIGFLKGINAVELANADTSAREAAKSSGFGVYRGIPFLGKAGIETGAEILDLATLYDGFDIEKETTLYMFAVALAYGVDAREFWPATSSGATKADASIQDMKTQGKGKGDVIETFTSMWHNVFPDSVEGVYDFTDDQQDLQRAQIWQVQANTYTALKASGTIDADEARAHLVKEGVLDTALLKASAPATMEAEQIEDTTPTQDVEGKPASNEKRETDDDPSEENNPIAREGGKAFELSNVKKKELDSTRVEFEMSFDNIKDGALARDYTRAQAERLLYRLIRQDGTKGFVDGMNDGGVEIADGSELEREDIRTINSMLSVQNGYISDFMADVYSDNPPNLDGKSTQWFNGSIMPFYYAGLKASGDNPMLEFVGSDGAKPCRECQALKGQRHRLADWLERGFNPPDGVNLSCHGGHHCKHTLERVRGRARGNWVIV